MVNNCQNLGDHYWFPKQLKIDPIAYYITRGRQKEGYIQIHICDHDMGFREYHIVNNERGGFIHADIHECDQTSKHISSQSMKGKRYSHST